MIVILDVVLMLCMFAASICVILADNILLLYFSSHLLTLPNDLDKNWS